VDEIEDAVYARRLCDQGKARALRDAAGLSRADLARKVGCSESAVWAWEARDRAPRGRAASAYGALLRQLAQAVEQVSS